MKNSKMETEPAQRNDASAEVPQAEGPERVGKSFMDFVALTTKWRKFIMRFIFIATVLAVVIALISPKWYKATASVFPAEKTDLFSGLEGASSLLRNFSPARGLSALTGQNETDRYLAILNSETELLKVIDHFDLTKVYDITHYPREKTMKELISNTEFSIGNEGQLEIDVYDKDPQRAADMANYFVKVLNDINAELHVVNARANRIFVEQRYNQNISDLRKSEDSLRAFQIKYGVVALPQQLEASIKAMSEIYGQLAIKQVELDVLRKSYSETHPSVVAAKVEVNALQDKINELNNGDADVKGKVNILVPFRQAPDLGVKYVRLYRNVEIQNKILEFVTPLYEQAKVEEQRATPSVIVLDSALVPERKSKPKAALWGLITLVASTLVAFSMVFGIEAARKLRMQYPEPAHALWTAIRTDWFGLKWTRNRKL